MSDFLALAQEVGEAGLTTSAACDGIVGGIGVGGEQTVDLVSQQLNGGLAAAMGIDPEDRERFVAGIPEPDIVATLTPVGFPPGLLIGILNQLTINRLVPKEISPLERVFNDSGVPTKSPGFPPQFPVFLLGNPADCE